MYVCVCLVLATFIYAILCAPNKVKVNVQMGWDYQGPHAIVLQYIGASMFCNLILFHNRPVVCVSLNLNRDTGYSIGKAVEIAQETCQCSRPLQQLTNRKDGGPSVARELQHRDTFMDLTF